MLRKLLKYELRATSRTMLPVLGLMLLLSVMANLTGRWSGSGDMPTAFAVIMNLVMIAFILGISSLWIVTIVLMVMRFRNDLLRDQGYIAHTLPVSVHAQIWSKVIVSSMWYAACAVTIVLSILLLAMDVEILHALGNLIVEAFRIFSNISATEVVIEILAAALLGCLSTSLMFYASLSVGHSSKTKKMLVSIGVFLVLSVASNMLSNMVMNLFGGFGAFIVSDDADFMGVWRSLMGYAIVSSAVTGTAYYFITAWFLKNRLNLD